MSTPADIYAARRVNPCLLELIVNTVTQWWDVTPEALMGTGRGKYLVQARWVVWALLRREGNYSYPLIAKACGVTHGAVMHGVKQAQAQMRASQPYYNKGVAAQAVVGETRRVASFTEDRLRELRLRLAELEAQRDALLDRYHEARADGKPHKRHLAKAVAAEEAMEVVAAALKREGAA